MPSFVTVVTIVMMDYLCTEYMTEHFRSSGSGAVAAVRYPIREAWLKPMNLSALPHKTNGILRILLVKYLVLCLPLLVP